MHLCCFCGQSCPLFRVSEMEKGFFLKWGLDLPLAHFLMCLYRTLGVCPHCRFRPAWMGHWSYKKDTWAHLAPSQGHTKRGDLKRYPSPWPNPAWTQVGLKTGLEKHAHVLWLQVEQTDDPKEIKADEVLFRVQGNTSSEPWVLRPVLGVHWWGDRSGPWTQGWGGWEKTLFSGCVWFCLSSVIPDPSLIFF